MSARAISVVVRGAGIAFGLALFAYAVDRVGWQVVVEGVARVGWGFVPILAIAGARFVVRAESWRLCMTPGARLGSWQAFSAFLAGDAVGNVTPFGLLASEPMKVFLTRHRLATLESASSLALETVLYSLSVLAMIALGLGLMLFTLPLGAGVRWATLAAMAALLAGAVAAFRLLRTPSGLAARVGLDRAVRLMRLRDELRRLAGGRPGQLARVLTLELLFHVLAIVETYLTLHWLLGDRSPSIVEAILFETINRVVTVAFKFVPFRIGVDEAASGALAPLLAMAMAAGVALAVVRKVRMLFWSAIGLLLVATHPAGPAPAPGPAGLAPRNPIE